MGSWGAYIVVSIFAVALFGYGYQGWERVLVPPILVGMGFVTGLCVGHVERP